MRFKKPSRKFSHRIEFYRCQILKIFEVTSSNSERISSYVAESSDWDIVPEDETLTVVEENESSGETSEESRSTKTCRGKEVAAVAVAETAAVSSKRHRLRRTVMTILLTKKWHKVNSIT